MFEAGIVKHQTKDADVLLFHKVYENIVDENYRFIHNKFKANGEELLRIQL